LALASEDDLGLDSIAAAEDPLASVPDAAIANPMYISVERNRGLFVGPIPNSNWAIPKWLLMGGFPEHNVQRLLEANVSVFVNLMTPDEVKDKQRRLDGYFESAVRIIREDQVAVMRATMERQRTVQTENDHRNMLPGPRAVRSSLDKPSKRSSRPGSAGSQRSLRPGTPGSVASAAATPFLPQHLQPTTASDGRAIPQPRYKQALDALTYVSFPIREDSTTHDRDTVTLAEFLVHCIVEQKLCVYVHSQSGHGRPAVICALVLGLLAVSSLFIHPIHRLPISLLRSPQLGCSVHLLRA
jgi:hypothetical protein